MIFESILLIQIFGEKIFFWPTGPKLNYHFSVNLLINSSVEKITQQRIQKITKKQQINTLLKTAFAQT
jgi:hypothetical protein